MGNGNTSSVPLLINVYNVTGTVSLSITNATWDVANGFYVQSATANTTVNPSQIEIGQGAITVDIGATIQSLVLVCSTVLPSLPAQISITPTFSEYEFLPSTVAAVALAPSASATGPVTKSGASISISINS